MQTQNPEKVVAIVNDCESELDNPKEPLMECGDNQSATTTGSSKLLGKRFMPQEFSQENLYLDIPLPAQKKKLEESTKKLVRREIEKLRKEFLSEIDFGKSQCVSSPILKIISESKDLIGEITQNLEDIEHHMESISTGIAAPPKRQIESPAKRQIESPVKRQIESPVKKAKEVL